MDHCVNPWPIFGGLLVVINYQWKMEELGVIMSKIYNINWLSAVMKVLQLHHFLLCMSTTLKDLKKRHRYKNRTLPMGTE